jgi:hypothetical protein
MAEQLVQVIHTLSSLNAQTVRLNEQLQVVALDFRDEYHYLQRLYAALSSHEVAEDTLARHTIERVLHASQRLVDVFEDGGLYTPVRLELQRSHNRQRSSSGSEARES